MGSHTRPTTRTALRGLLVDHVTAGSALLDLYAATDREAYLDMAQELMLLRDVRCGTRRVGDSSTGVSMTPTSGSCVYHSCPSG